MSRKYLFVTSLIVLVTLFSACSSTLVEAPVDEAALELTGAAAEAWSMAELEGMETMEVDYTNKDGETTTYTGVPLGMLLESAGVDTTTGTVTFVAADGYSAEIDLAELMACEDCIVAFDGESLRTVLPDQSGKLQVKDLIEIQVQ
jgi:DMSO/TMAO reductase YedYZ molybdopterin-dependent catalytic subunit